MTPFAVFFILLPFLIALFTALFQLLWNTTLPELFNFKTIRFWQAFRLLLLAGFVFSADSFLNFNFDF